jgi:hypothetical protein
MADPTRVCSLTQREGQVEPDFFTVLDQTLARLYSYGRVSYNALKLQFHLDDAHLAVLSVRAIASLSSGVCTVGGYAGAMR